MLMLQEEKDGTFPLLTESGGYQSYATPRHTRRPGGTAQFAYGSSLVRDTLQSLRIAAGLLIDYDLDRAFEVFAQARAIHNRLAAEMISELAAPTTDRLRRYGNFDTMVMQELDETGVANVQKVTAGVDVGFPLRKYGLGLQWTWDYLRQAQTWEVAAQMEAALTADSRNLQRLIRNVLFNPTNYNFTDKLVDSVTLPVRALANSVSANYPIGPNAEIFDGVHNHFLVPTVPWATSSVTPGAPTVAQLIADVTRLTNHVAEHVGEGDGKICIHSNQANDFLRMTPDFTQLFTGTIIPAITDPRGIGVLNDLSINNRQIGWFRGFQVWVKPWVPANYVLAYITGAMSEPPLVIRTPKSANNSIAGSMMTGGQAEGAGDLMLVSDNPGYPFLAKQIERRVGVSVWNRVGAASMWIGNASTYAIFTS